jgi:hypothetical protein
LEQFHASGFDECFNEFSPLAGEEIGEFFDFPIGFAHLFGVCLDLFGVCLDLLGVSFN